MRNKVWVVGEMRNKIWVLGRFFIENSQNRVFSRFVEPPEALNTVAQGLKSHNKLILFDFIEQMKMKSGSGTLNEILGINIKIRFWV